MSKPRTIAVLVSAGPHPVSGRRGAAPGDRAALELALRLGDRCRVVHVGQPDEPALADYLHMGAREVELLPLSRETDALPLLLEHLKGIGASLVLTGPQSGEGRRSGLLPYRLAEALDVPVAAGVRQIERDGEGWIAGVGLGFGRLHRLRFAGALLAVADPAGVTPRYGGHARLREATIRIAPTRIGEASAEAPRLLRPARRRPEPILPATGQSPAERFAMIGDRPIRPSGGAVAMSPEEAADAILSAISRRGLGVDRGKQDEPERRG